MKKELIRKVFKHGLVFMLIIPIVVKAQSCEPSELYGWATLNGGTTGGEGGNEVVVTTIEQLNAEAAKPEKLIIYVDGYLKGEAVIKSNKTIFGLPGSKIKGNVKISGATNIIVRNLIVRGDTCTTYEGCKAGKDAFNIGNNSKNIWLDHLDIADGQDGNCDVVSGSDFVTISWCKFSYTYDKQHRFSNLVSSDDGIMTDTGKLNITYHHNWWADRIVERQPRARCGKIQVANNLYTSTVSNYLAGPGWFCNMIAEGNITKTTARMVKEYPGYIAILSRNNAGPAQNANVSFGSGIFTPPYNYTVEEPNAVLETSLRQCAGATLGDPRLTAGLGKELDNVKISIAPQPFKDELKIEIENGYSYKLSNIQGRVLLEGMNSANLNTTSLSEGLYMLTISNGSKSITKKLVKRN